MARTKAFDKDKAQILALQLFWRKGYAATSIEDLVQALNLSRSSLYDTFGDKRTLFIESLKLYSARVVSQTSQTLNQAPTPLSGVQALLDGLVEQVGEEAGKRGCFMVNSIAELAPYDREVTEMAKAYNESIQRLLTETLRKQAAGNIRKAATPEQQAAYVFNAIQGLRILIKSGATREQAQAIVTLTLNNL